MAAEAYEMYNSRTTTLSFDKQSAELEFFCRGTTDDVLARAALIAICPLFFQGLPFEDLDVEPVGGGVWLGHASFNSRVTESNPGQSGSASPPPPPPPPTPSSTTPLGTGWAFDISVETEKITQSKERIEARGRGASIAPDTKGAIGVTLDGTVEGVDKLKPKLEFSLTRTFDFVTFGYINDLAGLVGKTNNATFFHFDAGQVLSIGASGQCKDAEKVEVTLRFAASPNEIDIVIAPDFVGVDKKGWEYLWVSYVPNHNNNATTMIPNAVYVDRIYDAADFSIFGIGT